VVDGDGVPARRTIATPASSAAPRKNGDDGIDVENPWTTLFANSAFRNVDLGIEAVVGVVDGGGNRAAGNGNQLQCMNVFCR
jgi:hypothetical protein